MKKISLALLFALFSIAMVGCSKEQEPSVSPTITSTVAPTTTPAMIIQIVAGENIVTYELNDSIAAKNLYEQLPLTVDVENYGSNEKIFYPPQALDVSDAPQASGGMGVLAYYAPWGDVVLFYDDFGRNSSLYELGHVVSGSEHIQPMREGTITIEAVP